MKTRPITKFIILLAIALFSVACEVPSLPVAVPEDVSATGISPAGEVLPQLTTDQSETVESQAGNFSYPIVDTAQGKCYDDATEIPCSGTSFAGQDAQYTGNAPRYQDNGDGTVTDLVTGLMWQQDPGAKMTFEQALAGAASFNLAGYNDWRLPTIKELYSLILFDGTDVSGCMAGDTCLATPFIDTRYFTFSYGDANAGERTIDSQFATSTKYVDTTMNGAVTMFGVNFADGRIKGYGLTLRGQEKTFYVLYVRGDSSYGQNSFANNGNGTITDNATGLTWQRSDSGAGMDWQSALAYCETLDFAGSSDWRLPNVKELQSLVDYSRSPVTSNSAAIDPLFEAAAIIDEAGQVDYPFYWSSTTHADSSGRGVFGAYIAFGRALGYMNSWVDVHGAGAQRSDPKTGSAADYLQGHGPQGDAVRVDNYVRCVRGESVAFTSGGSPSTARPTMQIQSAGVQQNQPGGLPGSENQQPGGMNGGGQSPMGGTPPQEAVNACSASTQGAACSFISLMGTVSGTCQNVQQQLACVPANRP